MDKKCSTCFYISNSFFEGPCRTCKSNSNWVAVDFLKNVPDDIGDPEGMAVMSKMAEQLSAEQGVKFDKEKAQWSLLPFRAVKEVVDVLTFGVKKYSVDNWKYVPQARVRYMDATFRHLADWHSIDRKDPETGKSHLAHAICCLLFLLWFEQEDDKKM